MQGIIIEYTALHDRKVTNLQLYDVYTVLVIVVSYDGMSICYAMPPITSIWPSHPWFPALAASLANMSPNTKIMKRTSHPE